MVETVGATAIGPTSITTDGITALATRTRITGTLGRSMTEKAIGSIRTDTTWTGTGIIVVNFGYSTRGE